MVYSSRTPNGESFALFGQMKPHQYRIFASSLLILTVTQLLQNLLKSFRLAVRNRGLVQRVTLVLAPARPFGEGHDRGARRTFLNNRLRDISAIPKRAAHGVGGWRRFAAVLL